MRDITASDLGVPDFTDPNEVRDGLGPMQRWERDRGEAVMTVIVQRVAEGETLRVVCKSRGWPYSVVAQWVAEDEAVASAYEQASRIWADELARETISIADSGDDVARDTLKAKVRQWVAGKLDRKRYGEVQDVKHSGSIGLSLMSVLASLPRASAERVVDGTNVTGTVVNAIEIKPSPIEHEMI